MHVHLESNQTIKYLYKESRQNFTTLIDFPSTFTYTDISLLMSVKFGFILELFRTHTTLVSNIPCVLNHMITDQFDYWEWHRVYGNLKHKQKHIINPKQIGKIQDSNIIYSVNIQ